MHKAYRTGKLVNEVLRGIDFDVAAGEFVSIIGPSGSGKSTLLHAIGGLDRDFTGEVEVGGRSLQSLSDTALSDYRNRVVGFVFQAFYLLPHLTVLENVALPALFARGDRLVDDAAAHARAQEVLDQVELGTRGDSKPTMLSGGQRQRVAIARALFHRPQLMLCDEPTGNLDSKMGAQIVALFQRLNRESDITVLIVTHDPRISAATPRTLRVEDGRVIDEAGATPQPAPASDPEASTVSDGEPAEAEAVP
ncbi:MAG: ABC transporter ATP-binding protein [Nannocystaceae bacterium]|nr:ABC transporter ATP-binding protein [Nannocystaceae bacterium]